MQSSCELGWTYNKRVKTIREKMSEGIENTAPYNVGLQVGGLFIVMASSVVGVILPLLLCEYKYICTHILMKLSLLLTIPFVSV